MEKTVKELLEKVELALPKIVAGAAIAAFAELAMDIDLLSDSALIDIFLFYAYGLIASLFEPPLIDVSERQLHQKLDTEDEAGIRAERWRKQLLAFRFCGEVLNVLFIVSVIGLLHLFCTGKNGDGWWHAPVFAIVSIVVLRIAAKVLGVNCMYAFKAYVNQKSPHESASSRADGRQA